MGRLIKESHQSANFLEQSPRGFKGGRAIILLELVLSEGREGKVGERGAKGLPSMQKTRKLRKEAWRAILKVIKEPVISTLEDTLHLRHFISVLWNGVLVS
jgi:hypothetical protein